MRPSQSQSSGKKNNELVFTKFNFLSSFFDVKLVVVLANKIREFKTILFAVHLKKLPKRTIIISVSNVFGYLWGK
jgi:hypothetical protein